MGMESVSVGVRKGTWTEEEDILLRKCIEKYGEGKWPQVPLRAGLNRCRKSCRMRWVNHLQPNLKKGRFGFDEVDLLIRLHKLLGNRWSLIAGRLPGRTANDVKNYWVTHLAKKIVTTPNKNKDCTPEISVSEIVKPKPLNLSKRSSSWLGKNARRINKMFDNPSSSSSSAPAPAFNDNDNDNVMQWWENLYTNANEIGQQKNWSSFRVFEEEEGIEARVMDNDSQLMQDLTLDIDLFYG